MGLPQAETDWSKEILIHNDIIDQLSEEIDKIPPQTIYMGYHTDPYQPSEANYYQTRKVLELFFKNGFSASILTKSDLIVRDIDILKKMNAAAVSVSVAFNDNRTRRLSRPIPWTPRKELIGKSILLRYKWNQTDLRTKIQQDLNTKKC